jgi:hypothetical protein
VGVGVVVVAVFVAVAAVGLFENHPYMLKRNVCIYN